MSQLAVRWQAIVTTRLCPERNANGKLQTVSLEKPRMIAKRSGTSQPWVNSGRLPNEVAYLNLELINRRAPWIYSLYPRSTSSATEMQRHSPFEFPTVWLKLHNCPVSFDVEQCACTLSVKDSKSGSFLQFWWLRGALTAATCTLVSDWIDTELILGWSGIPEAELILCPSEGLQSVIFCWAGDKRGRPKSAKANSSNQFWELLGTSWMRLGCE